MNPFPEISPRQFYQGLRPDDGLRVESLVRRLKGVKL